MEHGDQFTRKAPLVTAWHVGKDVPHQVDGASLLACLGQCLAGRSAEAGVVVGNDQTNAGEATPYVST